jgi:crossover junction endodeoxyribonuclease RuvC
MIILGVDPGLITTGVVAVRCEGALLTVLDSREIKTSSRDALPVRLRCIYEGLELEFSKHKPDSLVLEKIFSHAHHPAAALALGHARGVIALVAGRHDIPLIELPATRVKRAVTSRGHASKRQVQQMVSRLTGLKGTIESEHVADALALVVAYSHTLSTSSILEKMNHDRKIDRRTGKTGA